MSMFSSLSLLLFSHFPIPPSCLLVLVYTDIVHSHPARAHRSPLPPREGHVRHALRLPAVPRHACQPSAAARCAPCLRPHRRRRTTPTPSHQAPAHPKYDMQQALPFLKTRALPTFAQSLPLAGITNTRHTTRTPCTSPAHALRRRPTIYSKPVLSRTTASAVHCSCPRHRSCFRPVHARAHHLQRQFALTARLPCLYILGVPSITCVRRGHSPPSAQRPFHPTAAPILSSVPPPDTRASGMHHRDNDSTRSWRCMR
jgi:hypothetical protein